MVTSAYEIGGRARNFSEIESWVRPYSEFGQFLPAGVPGAAAAGGR